ncbi:hypothetical protein HCUR_00328 [Holospora curviuscula]|uniref:Transposase IS4-like domain-containing protein n=1 Tax=Holospora curviuscula TaxID=1082868 RepID=A0A2S5RDE9_9PROT|nr:hypothetical protein HCUR_00328 [Holospora curviuscula]
MLPKDFPKYSIVHSFSRRFRIKRIWEKVLSQFVKISRIKASDNEHPSYSRIDLHSVKTTRACEQRDIGGGKKGRKRYRVVDIQGNLVHGTVYDANHSRGVQCFLRDSAKYPTLKSVFVDFGYGKTMLAFVGNGLNKTIKISEP